MMRDAFIRGGDFQQPLVVPHPAEEREADRIAAADKAGRYGDLRQAAGRGGPLLDERPKVKVREPIRRRIAEPGA